MSNSILFGTGLFCFFLAIVGVVLTVQEFKNMELKEKLKNQRPILKLRPTTNSGNLSCIFTGTVTSESPG